MSSRFLRSLSLWAADDFLLLLAAPFFGAFGGRGTSSASSSSMSLSLSLSKSWFISLRPLQGCFQPFLGLSKLDAAPQVRVTDVFIPPCLRFFLQTRIHSYLGVHAQN